MTGVIEVFGETRRYHPIAHATEMLPLVHGPQRSQFADKALASGQRTFLTLSVCGAASFRRRICKAYPSPVFGAGFQLGGVP